MRENGPHGQIRYRMPGANEVYPFKQADRAAARHAMLARQRKSSHHLAEISVFYMKVVLLLGALFLAYSMVGPHL